MAGKDSRGACHPRHKGKGDAAYYRGHAEAMRRAMEWGCTPAEAVRRMAEDERKAENDAWLARRASRCGTSAQPAIEERSETEERAPFWWNRD